MSSLRRALARQKAREEVPVEIPVLRDLGAAAKEFPTRPVSVVMIVKNCAAGLAKCLDSLRRQFVLPEDEILVVDTGSTDGGATKRIAETYLARVIERPDLSVDIRPYVQKWMPEHLQRVEETGLKYGTLLDFAAARQVATDEAKHDIQFWIDSDDVLKEQTPGRLRLAVNKFFQAGKEQLDQIFLDYHYAHAEDGSLCSILKRERVFDRRVFQWKGRCHETCIPITGDTKSAYFNDMGSFIEHCKEPDDRSQTNPSDIRNYVILRKELEESEPRPDPRTIFYLGNGARGVHHDAEAIELYKRFIPLSGNRDDVYAAHYYIATIYCGPSARRALDAIDWYMECIKVKPDDPRGYFGLARAYFQINRFNECLHWTRVGERLPEPSNQLHNYDPRHIKVLPLQILALCAEKMENLDLATEAINRLREVAPDHPETISLTDHIANWMAGRGLTDAVNRILSNCGQGMPPKLAQEEGRRIIQNLQAVPMELEDRGLAKLEPTDTREGPELIIYCAKAPEPWGPRSGDGGIGGSEKAVVMMAPLLQKRGYRVSVYANVPFDQRGIDKETGVNWQHYGAMDTSKGRGICIFWRAPEMLEIPVGFEKRILWCHDVQHAARWNRARAALCDQLWVLSKFHKTTLPQYVQDELGDRCIVTRNGIDAKLYREAVAIGGKYRDPKKIIYASSPDRGVMTAIKIFQAANIPGSTLHLFYGFNKMYLDNAAKYEYAHIPDVGHDKNLYWYMQEVLAMCDQDHRIRMHGRVGWRQMAAEAATAGVWLYPTRFPEISCMTAMETQAAGCIPVQTDFAALEETVLHKSFVIPPDISASAKLFEATEIPADAPERAQLSERALEAFNYDKLADEWIELLKK